MITKYFDLQWTGPSGATYEVPMVVSYSVESDYGADADGNRGMRKLFLEELYVDGDESEYISNVDDLESFYPELLEDKALDRIADDE